MTDWTSLTVMGKYATIVLDPPWSTKGRHGWEPPDYYARNELLTVDQLKSMPIPEILEDDALVFMWTINTHLPDAYDILKAWGLRYWMSMIWVKPHGPKPTTRPTYNAEHIVVASKGKPEFLTTKDFRLANEWPRGAHSEKPEDFYVLLRRVTKGPRLDIFNRRYIEGFDGWGLEAPCEEHDWVIPRSTGDLFVFGICSICGEVEEFVNAMQSLPTNGG